MEHDVMFILAGSFAPFVAISTSPLLALSVISFLGAAMNAGWIDYTYVPMASVLLGLPISNFTVFVVLAIITVSKYLFDFSGLTKALCEVTLGKIEYYVGQVITVLGAFLITTGTVVYAMDTSPEQVSAVPTILGFILAVGYWALYMVIKTVIGTLDFLYVLLPIPFLSMIISSIKNILVIGYTFITVFNPVLANVMGLVILLSCCLVFKRMVRLKRYYRNVYIYPVVRKILFKQPRSVNRRAPKELKDKDICLDCYVATTHRVVWLYKNGDDEPRLWQSTEIDSDSFETRLLYIREQTKDGTLIHLPKDYQSMLGLQIQENKVSYG